MIFSDDEKYTGVFYARVNLPYLIIMRWIFTYRRGCEIFILKNLF